MESIKIGRFEAAKKKQRRQQVIDNVIVYVVTPLVCTLFCSSPLWFPFLCSFLKALLFVTLPELGSAFLTTKSLFILGNLIVVILVRESKIFASGPSISSPGDRGDPYYDEYVTRRHSLINTPTVSLKKEAELDDPFVENVVQTYQEGVVDVQEEVEDDDYGGYEEEEEEEAPPPPAAAAAAAAALPAEDLNKRADDFIARINKQRRLEASLLSRSAHF